MKNASTGLSSQASSSPRPLSAPSSIAARSKNGAKSRFSRPREAYLRIPARRAIGVANFNKIARPAIERHAKSRTAAAACRDLGLEISGDETRRRNAIGREARLKERARHLGIERFAERKRRTGAPHQAGTIDTERADLRRRLADARSADAKSLQRSAMVVIAPAGNVGKGNRVENRRHHFRYPRGGGAIRLRPPRSRQASSSGRACRYRVRRSRRRGWSAPRSHRPPQPGRPCRACS